MLEDKPQNLIFNKSGEAVFGRVKPTAFAWNYPWPPSSTNVNKNKVYRPSSGETSQLLQEARENLQREANVAASISPKYEEEEGKHRKDSFCRKLRVPDIELAIYWDRNPYRQRVIPNQNLLLSKQRSKSAANVSCLKELLDYSNLSGHNGEKSSRENSQRDSTNTGNGKEIHKKGCPAAESSRASTIAATPEDVSAPEQQPSENCNIQQSKEDKDNEGHNENKSGHQSRRQSSSLVSVSGKEDADSVQGVEKPVKHRNRVKSVGDINKNGVKHQSSFEEELNPEKDGVRAVGVQVSSDNVSLAALKSISHCPVHGHGHYFQQDQKEKELREQNFKARLATAVHPDNMACGRCSRHHSRSRARTASSVGKQDKSKTDQSSQGSKDTHNETGKQGKKSIKPNRSKTAKSEYAGNFRHPIKLSPSYNRQLRNKILSYCFTKQSIF